MSVFASPDGLKRLHDAKARLNLSFAAIAKRAGVSASTVSRLFHPERGKGVSEESLGAIVQVLALSPETIRDLKLTNHKEFIEPDDEAWAKAKRRIQKALRTEATCLDLAGLNLTTVPKEVGKLVNLTVLHLSHNQLTTVPKELERLVNLTELYLSDNQLTTVPKELGQLVNLTVLVLSDNQLTTVPEELGQLANLVVLSLYKNKLTTVPKELGQLTKLTLLSLDHNQLTTVPKELGQLVNLQLFSLSHNQLTMVPKELGELVNLIEFYLSHNQLLMVPKELGQSINLSVLSLSHNQLTTVPKELGKLANLTQLYLFNNQLTTVPKEFGKLSNLTVLSFSQNQLITIPKELGQLANLTQLSLAQNRLTTIPKELGQLTNLTKLYLYKNQLTAIPKELRQLDHLIELYLHGNNALGLSAESLGPMWEEGRDEYKTPNNPKDILNYYFSLADATQPLNESKLILVGFGFVGKTSLINRLIHHTFDPDCHKTQGVQITQWPIQIQDKDSNLEDITLHVWDFGGQEIMHSTHQFFLTERSLYILVLNGRQGHEDSDAEYWLELIQSFGGNSSVLVVLNKIQEQPFDVNRRALLEKYPNIKGFIRTDCKANIGIDQLQAAIHRETDRLEHLRAPFPRSWSAIKDRLADMTENYISFEKYRNICQQDGETEPSNQDSLAVYLHSLGIALNYKDDPRLRDTHVLNPRWVTNGIYTLLNAHELANTNGELESSCLSHTLDANDYPPERHGFLLDLMRKFELCFRFQDDDHRYLIPDLLDKQQPAAAADFHPSECLNFRYEYPILPEGILPRFIVRTHVLSAPDLRWRTGVILEFEGNRALVRGDRQQRSITINIQGPTQSRRRLLAIIRSDFDRIHRSFKFIPNEQVPVPGHPTVTVGYKELLAREKQNRKSFDVFLGGEELLELNVQDLLNGVDLEGSRDRASRREWGDWNRRNRPLRLFYSYSHKDERLRDELDTHLKILERQKLISPWSDRCIMPGDEWNHEIDDNLNRADIILLLISADFIASDYCYDHELARAMERHENGEACVIPIIVRSVDWKEAPFVKLRCLPSNRQAVKDWDNRDAAWFDVETGIKQAIESINIK